MNTSILRNDILSKGAILGGVMLVARIAELLMRYYGGLYLLPFIGLVAIVSMVIYCCLMYIFTKNYSKLVVKERTELPHFTYGNGLSYAILISMLAGVIVAIGSYIVIHGIIGYENYMASYVELIKNEIWWLQQMQPHVNISLTGAIEMFKQILSNLESAQEPTLITTIIASAWSYLISGVLVGVIVAIFTRRKPQIVKKNEEQEKQDEQ